MVVSATIAIDDSTRKNLSKALKALGDKDAPYLEKVLDDGGKFAESRIKGGSPGVISQRVSYNRVTGSGVGKVAKVRVKHPAILPYEFGRTKWKRGGQVVVHRPGFEPRPIIGVKAGDKISGEVRERMAKEIPEAIKKEWARFAN